jgi:LCP family protein required for cell wall assembly
MSFPSDRHPRSGTDGFVRTQPGRKYGGPDRRGSGAKLFRQQTSSFGNFRAVDGFYPKTQAPISGTHNAPLKRGPHLAGRPLELDLPKAAAPPKRFRANVFKHPLWQNKGAKALVAVLLVGVLTSGYLIGKGYLTARQVFRGGGGSAALSGDISKLRGEGDGRINVLLLGRGGDGHEGADLTDTILIASIDPIHKHAALLSIPRDLYVQTDSLGAMKINAVFANAKNRVLNGEQVSSQAEKAETAGLEELEKVIEQTVGIPMHYHAAIDFEGFKQAVDAVGGVEINVTNPVHEVMHIDGRRYMLDVKKGHQKFDGFRALAYSRSRYTSQRGDFDRSERQRTLLMGLKDKVFSLGTLGNPAKLNQMLNAFGSRVRTNLSMDELLRVYEIGQEIDTGKIESIGLADEDHNYLTTAMLNGQSVVIPRAGVNDYKEIQSFIRNKLRDGFLANEDATIAVYNGTYIAGLGARTAEDLKSYGYKVPQVGDAPSKGYQDTAIVDLRGGSNKYTRRYLERRFRTNMVSKLPDTSIQTGSADFVIILGQNEVSRLEN